MRTITITPTAKTTFAARIRDNTGLADGTVVGRDGAPQAGLYLLGRLSLGSVIAADSLHDCLGAAADRWAEGVMARLLSQALDEAGP